MCGYNPRMARLLEIHPTHPQARLIAEVVATVRNGGLIAYPTDSSYALGCHLGNKSAMDLIHRIRQTDKKHNFAPAQLNDATLFVAPEPGSAGLLALGFLALACFGRTRKA